MAEIVLGIGSSHTPMLFTPPRDWPRYEERDRKMELLDGSGRPRAFDALLDDAGSHIAEATEPTAMAETAARCEAALDGLADALSACAPDTVVIIGDDQKELFQSTNLPAILIYAGESITNKKREPKPGEPSWWSDALAKYYGDGRDEDCPVDARLADHLVHFLVEREFDVARSTGLPDGRGEGHAFAFVHARLLERRAVPIVPVFLNTYYPPNQPTPQRCHRLGRAIRQGVASFDEEARIAVVASGGLSHFVVDPAFDESVLAALESIDVEALRALPVEKLNSGTSEIRNWIAMHGAVDHLQHQWTRYVPAYRTRAGTGTGCAFGVWQ